MVITWGNCSIRTAGIVHSPEQKIVNSRKNVAQNSGKRRGWEGGTLASWQCLLVAMTWLLIMSLQDMILV